LPGYRTVVERVPIGTLADGLAVVHERTTTAAFAYTWHEGTPRAGVFGRGFVYVGQVLAGPLPQGDAVPRYRRLTAASRIGLGVPDWGRPANRLLGSGFRAAERLRPSRVEMPLFDAMFPFAKRGAYFLLYGRRGLAEYQALVPHAAAADYLRALEREALRLGPPVVMASLKLFRGEPG